METALFFAVSKHFKIPAVALLFVADNLIENDSFIDEKYQDSKAKRQAVRQGQYEIGLELLLNSDK